MNAEQFIIVARKQEKQAQRAKTASIITKHWLAYVDGRDPVLLRAWSRNSIEVICETESYFYVLNNRRGGEKVLARVSKVCVFRFRGQVGAHVSYCLLVQHSIPRNGVTWVPLPTPSHALDSRCLSVSPAHGCDSTAVIALESNGRLSFVLYNEEIDMNVGRVSDSSCSFVFLCYHQEKDRAISFRASSWTWAPRDLKVKVKDLNELPTLISTFATNSNMKIGTDPMYTDANVLITTFHVDSNKAKVGTILVRLLTSSLRMQAWCLI
jgi:hypothetical protein